MGNTLPLGIRAIDRLTKAAPAFSVARMSPERLEQVQAAVIPDRGPASLLLGRRRKGIDVRTTTSPARHGDVPLRIYTPEAWSRTPRPVVVNLHGGGFVLGSSRQS